MLFFCTLRTFVSLISQIKLSYTKYNPNPKRHQCPSHNALTLPYTTHNLSYLPFFCRYLTVILLVWQSVLRLVVQLSNFDFHGFEIWIFSTWTQDLNSGRFLIFKLSVWASHCRNHVIELKADFTGDYKHFGHWIKQFFPFFFCSSPCCTSKDEESDSKYYHSIEKCYSKACRVCQTYVRTQMEKHEVKISEEETILASLTCILR